MTDARNSVAFLRRLGYFAIDWRSLPEAGLEELDTFRRQHLKD